MKKSLILLCLAMLPLVSHVSHATVEPPEEGSSTYPEPQITIIEGESKKIEVHQINGRVYKIKVTPKNGIPYYLVDQNGDGDFIRDSGADRMLVPEWVLISW